MGYSRDAVLGRVQTRRSRAKRASHGVRENGSRGGGITSTKDPGRLHSFQDAPMDKGWVDGAHSRVGGSRRPGERSNVLCNKSLCSLVCNLDTLQAFSLVDLPAFRRLLTFQRPSTNECDIPHRTSVAKAVHEKAHKVRETLKGLFAVHCLLLSYKISLQHIY